MTKYTDILTALRAATGPSEELDQQIAITFSTHVVWRSAAKFTSSIDATLALVEEKLPGWDYGLYKVKSDCLVEMSPPPKEPYVISEVAVETQHRSMPLAILMALFKALEVEDK